MRYGLLQDASGLHAIWGQGSTTTMAALSLAVVGGFALVADRGFDPRLQQVCRALSSPPRRRLS